MTEELLKKALQDEKVQEMMLSSILQEDFFVNETPKVSTLRECLESCEDEILETIYMMNCMIFTEKSPKKNISRNQKISLLEKNIKESFKEFLPGMTPDDQNTIENMKKGKLGDERASNYTLLSNGFAFGFIEGMEEIYVIPKELLVLYQEYTKSDEKKERDLAVAKDLLLKYLMINLFLSKEEFIDMLKNHYHINISEKEINKSIKEFTIYMNDKYYSVLPLENKAFSTLKKTKCDYSYKIISLMEFEEYFQTTKKMMEEIEKVVKSEEVVDQYSWLLTIYGMDEDYVEQLATNCKLGSKKKKELLKILEKYELDRRYMNFNGRTLEEMNWEDTVQAVLLDKKPKKTDLKSCVNLLSIEGRETIEEYFEETDENLLIERMIKDFDEIMNDADIEELEDFINYQNQALSDTNIDEYDLQSGSVFIYKEKETIKCFIPDEIMEILEEKIEEYPLENDSIQGLVEDYIEMNGILEDKKLQELLKEYHNIEVSKEELDEIAEYCDIAKIANKYYTFIEDLEQEEVEELQTLKTKFHKYKKIDLDQMDGHYSFKAELREMLENLISDSETAEDLYHLICFLTAHGVFQEEILNDILENANISLKSNQKKKILNLYNTYKKDIAVTVYNGYSITEYNNMNQKKSKKINRNDLCSCGSGKKYKKCCGK